MKGIIEIVLKRRYSIVFLLILALPVFLKLAGTGISGSLREQKGKVPRLFSDRGFQNNLKEFDKYFEKNFPFREELLHIRNYIYSKYLGVSPVDRVILGKNKWLFLKRLNESGSEIDYSLSKVKFAKGELEYWFRIFSERYQFLKERGIHLLIVIVPNKSTVYSEYLPEHIRKLTGGVRADQITRYFMENSEIPVLNLRELMIRNKETRQVYHRTDSHWNHYGAWLAYKAITDHFSSIYPGVSAVRFENFPKKKIDGPSKADLASMLTLQKSIYKENFERLFAPKGLKINQSPLRDFKFNKIRAGYFTCREGVLPKTIMIHDSFGLGLRKFMSASFSKIIFLLDWGFNFFPDLIEREKPSIVIYEIAERFFYRPVPAS